MSTLPVSGYPQGGKKSRRLFANRLKRSLPGMKRRVAERNNSMYKSNLKYFEQLGIKTSDLRPLNDDTEGGCEMVMDVEFETDDRHQDSRAKLAGGVTKKRTKRHKRRKNKLGKMVDHSQKSRKGVKKAGVVTIA